MGLKRYITAFACTAILAAGMHHTRCRADQPETAADSGERVEVYLANSSFHTGFIIRIRSIPADMIPALNDLRTYAYADIGWGQEEYYQNPDFTVAKAASALFIPSTSVIRIEAFNVPVADVIHWSDSCIRLVMDRARFIKLCTFIGAAFRHDRQGNLIVASTRGNGEIRFYKSNGTYHLFNTCNTWIAAALRESGYPISTAGISTARELFRRVEKFGEVLK